ncbi:WD40-repeat-containing domain protein [Xylariaceae sp. FL0662B]|nr:WD40-repeat-containing domain protein [Xylariaceae sp. FL0662B]
METHRRNIASLRSLTLDLPPSCVEFCPAHPDHFVVGTYNLQREEASDATGSIDEDTDEQQQTRRQPQSRDGSLVVFRLSEATDDITHLQTVPYPSAILDLHFHPHREGGAVLAVVSSTGTLSFFRLSPSSESSGTLKEVVTHRPLDTDEGVLFLSCSWHPSIPDLLAISTSSCEVHILRVDDSWNVFKAQPAPVITHTLEAWTVAFSPFPTQRFTSEAGPQREESRSIVIFSGGDDSKLLRTSCEYRPVRDDEDYEIIQTPWPAVAISGHEAGVTAILPLNLKLADGSSVVVTGSYDDRVRVYSMHSQEGGVGLQKPRVLAEENLGGGVWRLRLVKLEEIAREGTSDRAQQWRVQILASCMHAGSRILEITGDYAEVHKVKVLGRFEEHKSMNYASDFQPGTELGGRPLRCVSTSFYDKLLCLWEYE